MKKLTNILLPVLFAVALVSCSSVNKGLRVHYDFKPSSGAVVKDATGNGNDATLQSGAVVKKIGKYDVMDLGTANGYLDMGTRIGETMKSIGDYTIATYLRLYPDARVRANGNFVWAFSTLALCGATTGEFIAYRVNQQRVEQSNGGSRNELVGVMPNKPAEVGVWHLVTYSQTGETGTLYINGEPVASAPAPLNPSSLTEPTKFNWLGRPHFPNDIYLKAMYHDFRIYDRGLTQAEIQALMKDLDGLNAATE